MQTPQPQPHDRLSEEFGCQVDLLDFSVLPTGTHKILKAQRVFQVAEEAEAVQRAKISELIAISSGNYARALAHMANQERRKVILVIAGEINASMSELEGDHVELVKMEDIKDFSPTSDLSENLGLAYAYMKCENREYHLPPADVTNLRAIENLPHAVRSVDSYMTYELSGDYDDYTRMFCPVGSGELFFDLACNSSSRVYAEVQPHGIVPLSHPALTNRTFDTDVQPSYADKLVTPNFPITYHFGMSEDLLARDKPTIIGATEDEFRQAHALSISLGLDLEPSGAAGMVGAVQSFRERHSINIGRDEKILLVSTGKGYFRA